MIAGQVTALFGGPAPGQPVPHVVAELERLLALARAGELRAVAYAAVQLEKGGTITSGYQMASGSKFELAAAVMHLNARFGNDLAGVG